MRILCLHGKGTSAAILEAQIAGFRALLPSYFEYRFFDGEEPFESYPEISDVFPRPYFCYYADNSMRNVSLAHEYVREIMDEEGPFDAVIGFSQGAALAASVILHHQIENPVSLPLFRFAVFICGDLPFTRTSQLGVDVTQQYIKDGILHGDTVNEPEVIDELKKSASGRSLLELGPDSGYSSDNEDGEGRPSARVVRRFMPNVDKERIQIPTAHVYGAQDKDLRKSLALIEMCDKELIRTYMHDGGHNIPRSDEVHRNVAGLVQEVMTKSEIMC